MEAVHALFYPLFTQAKATSGVEKTDSGKPTTLFAEKQQ